VQEAVGSNPTSPTAFASGIDAPVTILSVNETILTTIAITGFGVAFFHAAIPTHWLPFVLAARVQKWSGAKTLAITALAGTGHVLVTAALGFLVTWCGVALSETIGSWFPRIAGAVLILFGLYYVSRQLRGKGHVHFAYPHEHLHEEHVHHDEGGHVHEHKRIDGSKRTSDRVAIASLLALLTFSPCEAFIPIYVSGIRYGWHGFGLLTVILSAGTVAGMVIFTGLTLIGTKQIQLGILEKYESGLMGVLLCVVGALVLLFEK
jgi:nickel/cobalt transporter (NicO) family protein